jgi:hypothetical protein
VNARYLLALGLALTASACDWPQAGTGGLAERQRAPTPAIEQASSALDRLSAAGGDRYAAADMVDARTLLTRARRQYAGGLTIAADADMARLNVTIERIETRLNAPPPVAAAVATSSTAATSMGTSTATSTIAAPVVTTYAVKPPAAAGATGAPVPLLR